MLFRSPPATDSGYGFSELEIRHAKEVPIESLLTSKFRKVGKTFLALCPLHNERSPSFVIYPKSNSFFCYGCNKGGDAITFIKSLYGFSFVDAVRHLTNHG